MKNNPRNKVWLWGGDRRQPTQRNFLVKLVTMLALLTVLTTFMSCAASNLESKQAQVANLSDRPIIDLTHPLYNEMAFWPGGVPFTKTKLVDYDQGYLLHKFEMGENTGTHVDAPAHFIKGNWTLEQIPIEDLIIPAIVIDVQDKAANNPDYQLSAAEAIAWEKTHGKIPPKSLVILNTGWYKRFSNPAEYVNMDSEKVMHFPGFGEDSAKLLVERKVVGIGIDTLSLDPGISQAFETHKVMLAENKYQIENLTNLDALPPTGATAIVGVLPVEGGSQAQARVLALLP